MSRLCTIFSVFFLVTQVIGVGSGGRAYAASEDHSLFLDTSVEVPFEPKRALFFLNFHDVPVEGPVNGTIVLIPSSNVPREEGAAITPRRYLIGSKIGIPETTKTIHYSLLVVGDDNRMLFFPEMAKEVGGDEKVKETTDTIRDTLLQRKELLKSWNIQVSAQDESLQRLREDASVIGNLGRILELKEDVERVERQASYLDQDLENLRNFLKLSKSRPTPKNYISREGQLTRQLAELAQAAKAAESQQFSRKSKAEGDLQRKLAIIEQTRLDDYDELQRQLLKVRMQRMQLEKDQKGEQSGRR